MDHSHPYSVLIFLRSFLPSLSSLLSTLSIQNTSNSNLTEVDLEDEPWYKFFAELEFGRPVSEGLCGSLC